MDIKRTLSVINRVINDFDENEIERLLTNVSTTLQNWGNATNQQNATEYSESMAELKEGLDNSELLSLQPLSFRIMKELGGVQFFGTKPYEVIKGHVSSASTPIEAVPLVTAYVENFDSFLEKLNSLSSAFDELGVEPHWIEDDSAEISVIVPDALSNGGITVSQRTIRDWNLVLGNISELAGKSRDSVTLVEVERGSLILVIGTTYAAAKVFFSILNMCLDSYKSILEIKLLKQQLDSVNAPGDVKAGMESFVQEKITLQLEEIKNEIIESIEMAGDRSKPELEGFALNAAKYILKQVDEGVQVEVGVPLLEEQEPDEENAETEHPVEEDTITELKLQDIADVWHGIESKERNVLSLPMPDLDVDDLESDD